MLKGIKLIFKVGIGCVAAVGLAQANTLTPVSTVYGDTSWQNIGGTSYTFTDTNHDGQINVGEKVTFTVDMQKTYWGIHAFDALKVWIDNSSGTNLSINQFRWNFDPTHNNETATGWYVSPTGQWVNNDSWKPWKGGDQLFSFDYTFTTAGSYDLVASVMCSADLSGLTGISQTALETNNDWSKWNENFHSLPGWKQGETDRYQFTVVASPVPEPQTYAMMLAGLGLIGFTVRRRKSMDI